MESSVRRKRICARCEAMDRKQKHSKVHDINGVFICDICLQEIADLELLFNKGADEQRGEIFNNELIEGDEFED
jgi:superfamily II helicase